MPRIFVRRSPSPRRRLLASFTPPALPRPPACTCAFTTTVPPYCFAIASASSGVVATSPGGIGHAFAAKDFFRLIFVDVHSFSAVAYVMRCVPALPPTAGLPFAQRRDDRAPASCGGRNRPPRESSAPCCPLRMLLCASICVAAVRRQPANRPLAGRSPIGVHRIDVRQNQQQFGAEIARQNRRGEIFVDHRVDAFPT